MKMKLYNLTLKIAMGNVEFVMLCPRFEKSKIQMRVA